MDVFHLELQSGGAVPGIHVNGVGQVDGGMGLKLAVESSLMKCDCIKDMSLMGLMSRMGRMERNNF